MQDTAIGPNILTGDGRRESPAAPAIDDGQLPSITLARAPDIVRLLPRLLILGWIGLAYFAWEGLSLLLLNYWLLESLGLESVFWTNFWAGAIPFAVTAVVVAGVIAAPVLIHDVRGRTRMTLLQGAAMTGIIGGYLMSQNYLEFLLLTHPESFGIDDPVYGHDIGFYVFQLPAIRIIVDSLVLVAVLAVISSVVCAHIGLRERRGPVADNRLAAAVTAVATPYTLVALVALGLFVGMDIWLWRYGLLTKDNSESSVYRGAEAIDVSGLFSTVHAYWLSAIVALAIGVVLAYTLFRMRRMIVADARAWRSPARQGAIAIAALVALDFGFGIAVGVRDQVSITPNEPVSQLEYIQRHLDATNEAYALNDVEIVEFRPDADTAQVPDPDELLDGATLRNTTLWAGSVSHLEGHLDPEYVDRVLETGGDTVILDVTLEALRQQEKLRPYYDFLDVDFLRYDIDGEPTILVSGVRELPLIEPQPWLTWWGQQFVLLTHGHGIVAVSASQFDDQGNPVFLSRGIPAVTDVPQLRLDNQRVYYGEGSGSVGFSNVQDLEELDFPTAQGRSDVRLQPGEATSVEVDSVLKKLVFAWKSGTFLDIFFSGLITSDTHIHYFRTPLERLDKIAPFLYYDSDPFAFPADGEITWMVNGMTTTDRYPYSEFGDLGEKSLVRSFGETEPRVVNYVRDSVKATVSAATGEVRLYKIADEPIVNAWANIYPDLFVEGDEMPESVRAQLQYPTQLFHLQFDDLYVYYHMNEAVPFFNLEDLWDDADEVLGPLIAAGPPVDFSIEPYFWYAETGETLPESSTPLQFAQSLAFTPEGARNLRALVTVYQDGEDYGRIVALQVPKGEFYLGPEQAEALIDQDPAISQQLQLWNRLGTQVIRGHIMPLVIGNEVIYIEPIYTRSEQLRVPQLKRVVVVYRGVPRMGTTLEDALRQALTGEPGRPIIVADAPPALTQP